MVVVATVVLVVGAAVVGGGSVVVTGARVVTGASVVVDGGAVVTVVGGTGAVVDVVVDVPAEPEHADVTRTIPRHAEAIRPSCGKLRWLHLARVCQVEAAEASFPATRVGRTATPWSLSAEVERR